MDYVKEKHVWTKIERPVGKEKGCRILKARWIDSKKGDDEYPFL